MMIDNSDFEALVMSHVPSSYDSGRFPLVHRDSTGDCFEVFSSDEPFNRERIDARLTVYRGIDSNRVIGAQVKGVSTWIARVLTEWPGMRLEVHNRDNKLALGLLFFFESMKSKDPTLYTVYHELSVAGKDWLIRAEGLNMNHETEACGTT